NFLGSKGMPKGSGKPIPKVKVNLDISDKKALLTTLEQRFEKNMSRHKGVDWSEIKSKLNDKKLASLNAMESTGGEPDVVKLGGKLVFVDCSEQSPERRSICYDQAGEEMRHKKGVYPGGNA